MKQTLLTVAYTSPFFIVAAILASMMLYTPGEWWINHRGTTIFIIINSLAAPVIISILRPQRSIDLVLYTFFGTASLLLGGAYGWQLLMACSLILIGPLGALMFYVFPFVGIVVSLCLVRVVLLDADVVSASKRQAGRRVV